jgi:hypothetical protein
MRNKRKKLYMGVAATTAAVALGGGIAFGVWTVSGSGSGGGAATVAQSLTVTAVTPTGAAATLYPGGPAGAVWFSVNNPNPFAVTITGITYGTPTSNNTTTCPNSNISIDGAAPTTVSISVPAGPATGATSIPAVLDLAHTAPNGCEGVSFNVPVTVTATQQ